MIAGENIFLIVLGFIWIIGAVLQDLKRREVDNVWNFSLVFFALSYRLFVSAYNHDYWFFVIGLIGFFLFFCLGYLFYYSRVFAGGDAKLLIALGPVLPFSRELIFNLKVFLIFIIGFLVLGSIYVFIWAIILMIKNFNNFKKEYLKQFKKHKKLFYIFLLLTLIWTFGVIFIGEIYFVLIGVVIILFPILLVFAKAVEESCMIVLLDVKKVTEGDWLYKEINVRGKKIKPNWEGISKEELILIQKYYKHKIYIKQGIPFTPGFLFAYILLIYYLIFFI